MKRFYFTVVVYVDNDEQLRRCIKSIYSVSKEVQGRIKLIIVDPICSEVTRDIAETWRNRLDADAFVYKQVPEYSLAEAYNVVLKDIRGYYVNFSLASTWFDAGALESVYCVAEERERPKLISLAPWTVNEKDEFLPYKMSPEATGNIYDNIRFYKHPAKLQLMFHAYFIRTFLVNNEEGMKQFRPELYGDATMEMLLELLAEWRGYVYISDFKYHYTLQLEDNTSAFLDQHYEWWYNDSFKNWILPFAKKWSIKNWPLEPAMRVALLYLVFARFNCNYNDRNKGVITGEKLQELARLTGQILQYIDNESIFRKKSGQTFSIPRTMRMMFLKLKAQEAKNKAEVVYYDRQLYLWMHRADLDSTEKTLQVVDSPYYPSKDVIYSQEKELAYCTSIFTVQRDEECQIPTVAMAYENNMFNALCKIRTEHVILNAINYECGMLEIDGTFSGGDFLEHEQIKLKVYRDDQVIPVEFSEVYGLNRVFGITYNRKYQFHVSVPATSVKGRSEDRKSVV